MAYTTINKSTDHFNTKLYTGSGSAQSLTGVGFQPDWIWIKNRSYADHHKVVDRVRWVSSSNSAQLSPNQDSAAGTQGIITSFDSDGFTLTTGDRGWNSSNGDNFVSWNWKANGQGSSNTDGTINTTYTSANTTAGFSISQYTGTGSNATVGHGLGAVPQMMIVKNLSTSVDWIVYHSKLGNTKNLRLNTNEQVDTSGTIWNNTTPTSSVFSIGTASAVNGSGNNFVAYCFTEKKGFSKFGQYKGNGSADGAFVYTGFKPAFVFCRFIDASNGYDYIMYDNKRPTVSGVSYDINPINYILEANTSDAENTSSNFKCDFLSNGFKFRGTESNVNDNGYDYIYWAIAAAPLVGSNNIPCTAR